MRVLILRTFAHTFIWEYSINHCKYYKTQLLNILDWEPDYKHFKTNQFSYALGIYMDMYFSYETRHTNTIVYQGTDNEQIISILKLNSSSAPIICGNNASSLSAWFSANRSGQNDKATSLPTFKLLFDSIYFFIYSVVSGATVDLRIRLCPFCIIERSSLTTL